MTVVWGLLLATCVMAAQATDYVKPASFPSMNALGRGLGGGDARIANGGEATKGQFPHQVALYVDLSAFCGGALISNKWVLTAAACIGRDKSRYTVFLGALNINMPAEKGRLAITTNTAYKHDSYDFSTRKNDIALVLLPREVSDAGWIRPINLPPKSYVDKTFEGSELQVSGWGYTTDGSVAISPKLHFAKLTGISNVECASIYSYEIISDSVLCCKSATKQSTCQGDNGGALFLTERDGSLTHIGVASFTPSSGCSKGLPVGFTRTTQYLDWIEKITGLEIKN